jgi:hypothetical protein
VEKDYTAKDPQLVKYLQLVRILETKFTGFTAKYIPRSENAEAVHLAKAAANNSGMPLEVFFQVLCKPSTEATKTAFKTVLLVQHEDWRQPIRDALEGSLRLETEEEEARISTRARSYTLINGALFKKGVVQPLLSWFATTVTVIQLASAFLR